jgi:phosphatidylserine/phosphatidylglycerophosphate/cardiolipin synthase-like enzyme
LTDLLRALSPSALVDLARLVEARGDEEFAPVQFHRLGLGSDSAAIAVELQSLKDSGLTSVALGRLLRLVADERRAAQAAADRTELVWTGPETAGAGSRDTAVVVRELFSMATRSVLVASYAIYNGKQVFGPLAARMAQMPGLQVRLFVNVARAHLDQRRAGELLKAYADAFQRDHWPGPQLPEVFYDPRSLEAGPGRRSALHAKAIVVDDVRAFVTSANFTEAAHDRNIEAGVLVDSAPFAHSLRRQFDTLVESGLLARIPLV